MNEMRRKKPREFWKMFKQGNNPVDESVTLDDFYNHFKSLDAKVDDNDDVQEFLREFDNNCDNMEEVTFEELDMPITENELRKVVNSLNRNKAAGLDNMINEYFKECIDILSEPLLLIFNKILDAGEFPSQWSEGLIIPILKKQPSNIANNYRGITLLSCLGKIFTGIINERMKVWTKNHDKLSDAQFGFKSGHSTTDAVFVLSTIIQKYTSQNKKVYAAFVDYQKCFDTIYRNGLWYKLIKEGFDGKLLKLLRSMYSDVRSCVKHLNSLSDFFKIDNGLFQGELTSPLLFCHFVNTLEVCLQEHADYRLTLDKLSYIRQRKGQFSFGPYFHSLI